MQGASAHGRWSLKSLPNQTIFYDSVIKSIGFSLPIPGVQTLLNISDNAGREPQGRDVHSPNFQVLQSCLSASLAAA